MGRNRKTEDEREITKLHYQRNPTQSSAQWFIKQRAVQTTELFQVAVWQSDISRQRQPLIYVLREKNTHTNPEC